MEKTKVIIVTGRAMVILIDYCKTYQTLHRNNVYGVYFPAPCNETLRKICIGKY